MRRFWLCLIPWMVLTVSTVGCHHPTVTAISLNSDPCGPECGSFWGVLHHCLKQKEEGIPFYLPKPLLIVAKNFRNIEETKVGLTDSAPIPNAFDDQSKYADLNARTNFNFDGSGGSGTSSNEPIGKSATQATNPATATDTTTTKAPPASTASKSGAYTYSQNAPNVTPGAVANDGLAPDTFFTYQIVFVPDLTQKYGLKIKGGVGEIRAAMNLVNGWQFTGLGPYYMKDSSTAQDVMASGIAMRLGGQAVQDVLKGVAGLTGGKVQDTLPASAPQVQQLARSIEALPAQGFGPNLPSIPNYAEIYVYEARLGPDGQMEWVEILNLKPFERHYLGQIKTTATLGSVVPNPRIGSHTAPDGSTQATNPNPQAKNSPPADRSGSAGALDPHMAHIISQVIGIPSNMGAANVAAVGGTVQSGTPGPALIPAGHVPPMAVAPALPAMPVTRPVRAHLFHHDKKRRGTAISRVVTAETGAAVTPGANPSERPTSEPPPNLIPPNVGQVPAATAPGLSPPRIMTPTNAVTDDGNVPPPPAVTTVPAPVITGNTSGPTFIPPMVNP